MDNQNKIKKVIFLHHSVGKKIWIGSTNRYLHKLTGKNDVQQFFKKYNKQNKTQYSITECTFPKTIPYGWKNYPYDYYNIWVKNAGNEPFNEEPTLEILTREYDVIIFKHCYPLCKIIDDNGSPDADSEDKRIENYKLQYNALKNKMHEFPNTKFIVWTPSVLNRNQLTENEAERTHQFYKWIMDVWNEKGDNIYIWDFYKYETEDSKYLLNEYSDGPFNSHPNRKFSTRLSPLFSQFVIDVIESVNNL